MLPWVTFTSLLEPSAQSKSLYAFKQIYYTVAQTWDGMDHHSDDRFYGRYHCEFTWLWLRSIFGCFAACNHLLVCLLSITALLNIEATWHSKSVGIAMPRPLAKKILKKPFYITPNERYSARFFGAIDKFSQESKTILTYIRQRPYAILDVKSLSSI